MNEQASCGQRVIADEFGIEEEVTIKTGPATVSPNGSITYTLNVVNNGPSAAAAVVVTDVLPAGVSFVSASNGGSNVAGTVTWPARRRPRCRSG